MSDVIRWVLIALVAWGVYREACVFRFYLARRRARRERFRGLRIVVRNPKPDLRVVVRFPERS
jgi:hypothetical protein